MLIQFKFIKKHLLLSVLIKIWLSCIIFWCILWFFKGFLYEYASYNEQHSFEMHFFVSIFQSQKKKKKIDTNVLNCPLSCLIKWINTVIFTSCPSLLCPEPKIRLYRESKELLKSDFSKLWLSKTSNVCRTRLMVKPTEHTTNYIL